MLGGRNGVSSCGDGTASDRARESDWSAVARGLFGGPPDSNLRNASDVPEPFAFARHHGVPGGLGGPPDSNLRNASEIPAAFAFARHHGVSGELGTPPIRIYAAHPMRPSPFGRARHRSLSTTISTSLHLRNRPRPGRIRRSTRGHRIQRAVNVDARTGASSANAGCEPCEHDAASRTHFCVP